MHPHCKLRVDILELARLSQFAFEPVEKIMIQQFLYLLDLRVTILFHFLLFLKSNKSPYFKLSMLWIVEDIAIFTCQ